MAERYGWTPAEIDTVDRARVLRWWAVQSVHRLADEHLAQFHARQQANLVTLDRMRNKEPVQLAVVGAEGGAEAAAPGE